MEQSQRDAATKAAWITGGLALAGTVLTLIFTNIEGHNPPILPTPSPAETISTGVPADPIRSSPVQTSAAPTPAGPVPEGVDGHWKGTGAGSENFHLTIASDARWTLIDGSNVQAGHVSEGKVVFNGTEAIFYYDNGQAPLVVGWAVVKTPTATFLHLGTYTYAKQ